jgi:hypothetical protein
MKEDRTNIPTVILMRLVNKTKTSAYTIHGGLERSSIISDIRGLIIRINIQG